MSTQSRKPAELTEKQRQLMRAVLHTDIPGLREQFHTHETQAVKPRFTSLSMLRNLFRAVANDLLGLYTILSTAPVVNRHCKYNGHVASTGSRRCADCGAYVKDGHQRQEMQAPRKRRIASEFSRNFWVDEKTIARLEAS